MNKFLLIGATWLLCAGTVAGQVRYGLQLSGQASTISSSVDLTPVASGLGVLAIPIDQRMGFRAGIMADIPLGRSFSVRPQLLYSVKGGNANIVKFATDLITKLGIGGTIDPKTLTNDLNSNVVLNYIELPVPIMYGLEAGPGRLLLGAGPYAAVAVGGTINGKAIDFNTDNFHKLDWGATASVGYELAMGLSVSAYYNYGLRNYSKRSSLNLASINPTNPTAVDPSAFGGTLYNRTYGISLGYLLPSRR